MAKNIVIAVLLVLVAWLAATVVRLENFHYASVVGMCAEYQADAPPKSLERHNCLHATQTRTSFVWHPVYAMLGE